MFQIMSFFPRASLVVSGIGTIADEKKKGSLLCLFALAGTLMLVSFTV